MFYFAYGSNLNHKQMKKTRCIGSKYIKNFLLKDYELSFCYPIIQNKFGHALIWPKKIKRKRLLFFIENWTCVL